MQKYKNQGMDFDKMKSLAVDYLKARETFIKRSKDFRELDGNDNIIGRIGEYIAMKYLSNSGRAVTKCSSKVNKGFDLRCGEEETISVKLITAENKSGRTTSLKQPWTELIIITLSPEYKVDRIGHILHTNFIQVQSKYFRKQAYAHRNLLKDDGLFALHGKLLKGPEVENYL